MTISEFNAWLDGFSEAICDAPTPEQWAKVLAKLKTVQALNLLPQAPSMPRHPYPAWPNHFITCGHGELACTVDEGTRIVGMGHAVSN